MAAKIVSNLTPEEQAQVSDAANEAARSIENPATGQPYANFAELADGLSRAVSDPNSQLPALNTFNTLQNRVFIQLTQRFDMTNRMFKMLSKYDFGTFTEGNGFDMFFTLPTGPNNTVKLTSITNQLDPNGVDNIWNMSYTVEYFTKQNGQDYFKYGGYGFHKGITIQQTLLIEKLRTNAAAELLLQIIENMITSRVCFLYTMLCNVLFNLGANPKIVASGSDSSNNTQYAYNGHNLVTWDTTSRDAFEAWVNIAKFIKEKVLLNAECIDGNFFNAFTTELGDYTIYCSVAVKNMLEQSLRTQLYNSSEFMEFFKTVKLVVPENKPKYKNVTNVALTFTKNVITNEGKNNQGLDTQTVTVQPKAFTDITSNSSGIPNGLVITVDPNDKNYIDDNTLYIVHKKAVLWCHRVNTLNGEQNFAYNFSYTLSNYEDGMITLNPTGRLYVYKCKALTTDPSTTVTAVNN